MLEVVSLKGLLARPMFIGGAWMDTRRGWARQSTLGLQILVADKTDIERAASSLGRSPSSIAWRAHDTGLTLPRQWRDCILKRQLASPPRQLLQYPYIQEVRGEHADLLEVNRLVPHSIPSHLRADICQEIMLAVWQKECSISDLRSDKSLLNSFIRRARKDNYEASGYAMSLDVPMLDGRSWYDVLPTPEQEEEDEAA